MHINQHQIHSSFGTVNLESSTHHRAISGTFAGNPIGTQMINYRTKPVNDQARGYHNSLPVNFESPDKKTHVKKNDIKN